MEAACAQRRTETRRDTISNDPLWPEKMRTLAMDYLKRYDSCTQSILWAFMEALGMQNRMVLRAAGRERLQSGLDGMMPIILPAQRMVKTLTERIGGHACLEMTGVDFTDLEAAMTYKLSGDHENCVGRVGEGTRAIAELLQDMDARGELFRV